MKYSVDFLGNDTWKITEGEGMSAVYMYLLKGTESAVLIDTGYGTIPLDSIVREIGVDPSKLKVLLTHGHVDHIGGTGFFEQVYMELDDSELYKDHCVGELKDFFLGDEKQILGSRPVDTIRDIELLFMSGLDLGGRKLSLVRTPGHSQGSVCFYDEKNEWLFTGDTCCKADVLLNMPHSGTVAQFRESVERILKVPFATTYPCHHEFPVGRETVTEFLTAADMVLSGECAGTPVDHPTGAANRLSYRDIAIVY